MPGKKSTRAGGAGRVSRWQADARIVARGGERRHLLEISPFEIDQGQAIGRDPRTVPAEDWQAAGIARLTGMQAIRAMCLSCVYTAAEVRKCVCTGCPLWPYRLGSVPKGLRDANTGGATKSVPSSPKPDAERAP